MNFAEKAFRQTLRRLVLIQMVFIIGVAVLLFSFYGKTSGFSIALIYGGFVSIIVTILRAWRLTIATEEAETVFDSKADTRKGQSDSLPKMELDSNAEFNSNSNALKGSRINALELYKGFALGYIVAIALLALGLGGFKFEPTAVIIGFVIAQFGHFFVRPPKPGAGR